MAGATHKPAWDASAAALREAIQRSGVVRGRLAEALKVSASVITTMQAAKSPVTPQRARILGRMLDIDPATIASPIAQRKKGGKRAGAGRPAGPAQRAVALLEAQAPPAVVVPRPVPILGMEALSDGTAHVWCKATLPHKEAAALFRLLLDFGLMPGEDGMATG